MRIGTILFIFVYTHNSREMCITVQYVLKSPLPAHLHVDPAISNDAAASGRFHRLEGVIYQAPTVQYSIPCLLYTGV